GLFMLPGGNRSMADRRLAQGIFFTSIAGALFTLKLAPIGLLSLVIGGALFAIGWLKQRYLGEGGFQDLEEDGPAGRRRHPSPAPHKNMTKEEAFAVLGLDQTADRQAVLKAHKRMIAKAHPDRGGSDYLASKVNEARDRLLK
ncbi:MAG: hypothetical protein AAF723_01120, partial [Pseudomonadota bacterium]